ncbi:hypothetical protein I317_07570 [Kwoniella heveanensis CBS 569]|nr:hypothetical protein I317_07570 [Kwoniella heveanensis CBS 569]
MVAASYLPEIIGGGALSSLAAGLRVDDIVSIGIRVALIGLLTAFVRSSFVDAKHRFYLWLFPCAHVSSKDSSSSWLSAFVARSSQAQSQLRTFRLITSDARDSKRDDVNRIRGLQKGKQLAIARKDATFVGVVVGKMLPIHGQAIYINHKGNHIWLTNSMYGYGTIDANDKYELQHWRISGVAWQPGSIQNFVLDCHAQFYNKSDDQLVIFSLSPNNGNWYDPIHRPARSWSSVILPKELKDPLLDDAKNFLSDEEKEWYADRGIPHRRGYLLHGRPGSGKTTLATAFASQLNVDIYIVNPAARGMDDGKLNKAFRNCPPQNMILIEDIDCVMPPRPHKGNNEDEDSADEETHAADSDNADPGKYGLAKSTVTLSGLLNAIDGVSSQEDCILVATTNHPERLDPALSRPGRFDVQLAFHDATPSQAVDLFKHFFPLSLSDLSQSAATEAEAEADEKMMEVRAEVKKQNGRSADSIASQEELDQLARKFADDIFTRCRGEDDRATDLDIGFSVSMAALQGYLLTHKRDPRKASERAGEWAHELKEAAAEKARQKRDKRALKEAKQAAVTSDGTPLSPAPSETMSPVRPASPASAEDAVSHQDQLGGHA